MACCCSIDLTITNLVFLGVLVFTVKKLIKFYQKWRVEQMLEKWVNSPRDKVLLHAFDRHKPLPSISPFCLKLETYLRMAKIPYELETKDAFGPKGKAPWITYNGQHIADSQLCIQFLNKKLSIDLNKNVKEEQLATAKACMSMLENHFMMGLAHFRWVENAGTISQLMKIPLPFKLMMPFIAGGIKKRIEDQGMGKHTPTEIYQMTEEDLRSTAIILGNRKFFGGDEPCEEDCAIFGSLCQAVWGAPGSSYERLVNGELSTLKQYCDRMKDKYWPDWDSCMDRS